jgi:serine/threonine protein kinase
MARHSNSTPIKPNKKLRWIHNDGSHSHSNSRSTGNIPSWDMFKHKSVYFLGNFEKYSHEVLVEKWRQSVPKSIVLSENITKADYIIVSDHNTSYKFSDNYEKAVQLGKTIIKFSQVKSLLLSGDNRENVRIHLLNNSKDTTKCYDLLNSSTIMANGSYIDDEEEALLDLEGIEEEQEHLNNPASYSPKDKKIQEIEKERELNCFINISDEDSSLNKKEESITFSKDKNIEYEEEGKLYFELSDEENNIINSVTCDKKETKKEESDSIPFLPLEKIRNDRTRPKKKKHIYLYRAGKDEAKRKKNNPDQLKSSSEEPITQITKETNNTKTSIDSSKITTRRQARERNRELESKIRAMKGIEEKIKLKDKIIEENSKLRAEKELEENSKMRQKQPEPQLLTKCQIKSTRSVKSADISSKSKIRISTEQPEKKGTIYCAKKNIGSEAGEAVARIDHFVRIQHDRVDALREEEQKKLNEIPQVERSLGEIEHERKEIQLQAKLPFIVKGKSGEFVADELMPHGCNAYIFASYKKDDPSKSKNYIVKLDYNLSQEVYALSRLSHPNIIQIIDHGKINISNEEFDFIVLPRYEAASYNIISDHKLADIQQLQQIAESLIHAVRYCHRMHFMLRDIKVDNIVKKKNTNNTTDLPFQAVLIDFGVAVPFRCTKSGRYIYADTNEDITEPCGTVGYMAKEVQDPEQPYGPQCDVFSLGITLAEIAFGRQFHNLADPVQEVLNAFMVYYPLKGRQKRFEDLIKGMIEHDPKKRLTTEACMQHNFFI